MVKSITSAISFVDVYESIIDAKSTDDVWGDVLGIVESEKDISQLHLGTELKLR
jgi:hypothetical protein